MSEVDVSAKAQEQAAIKQTLIDGLLKPQAEVSPKYLYDSLGARLFEAITELPEYSPSREERDIFAMQKTLIAKQLPRQAAMIDLGAGSCRKAANLIPALKPEQYIAVDISENFLRDSLAVLGREFPALTISALVTDFSNGLPAASVSDLLVAGLPRIFFYPGSSIGNFHPGEALDFLKGLRIDHQADALIIGIDLVKPAALLEAAYDDSLGVTAAFNKNLLLHLNRLLAANFRVDDWSHRAVFQIPEARIQMHLVARHGVCVRWPGGERVFEPGESIHTENSYKYTIDSFSALLSGAGYTGLQVFQGPDQGFAVFVAQVG